MRLRQKLLFLSGLIAAIGAGALLGGVGREGSPASHAAATPPPAASLLADAIGAGGVRASASQIAKLEATVRRNPRRSADLTALGFAYLQRWRDTADASFLPRAETALLRAGRVAPSDALVLTGLGSLALTRHEFGDALLLGRRAQKLAPFSVRPLGVVGDALLELGRYPEAFAAFERMSALKPNVASYTRIAYARELIGHRRGAIEAMELALGAASGQPEASAWVAVELAKLEIARGRIARADRLVGDSLVLVPGYVYALEQQARIAAARDDLPRALRIARNAALAVPLPQMVSLLVDLEKRAGNADRARSALRTAKAIDRLLASDGIRSDIESVLFDADHRLRTDTLVARARAARAAAPSIWGDDAVAWALARTGRCREARTWSDRSLRLGTRDGLLFFHRAAIEQCAGSAASARSFARRALTDDPHFSVRWEPAARRLAAGESSDDVLAARPADRQLEAS
jgi:tetratricopeptide (TPR) repeat protein